MAGVELFDPVHPTKETMLGDTDGRWPPRSSRSTTQQLFQCEAGCGVFVSLADVFVDEQMGGGLPISPTGDAASPEPEMTAAPFTVQVNSKVFVRPVSGRMLAAAGLSV